MIIWLPWADTIRVVGRGEPETGAVLIPKTVLVHNILAPYRLGLFNALDVAFAGRLTLLLGRENHPRRRAWHVDVEQLDIPAVVLRSLAIDRRAGAFDVALDTRARLNELDPDVVIVTGYDLPANWVARSWARNRGKALIAWVETWEGSTQRSGPITDHVRRRYFRSCDAFIVPGLRSQQFVERFAPGKPMMLAPNSVDRQDLRQLPSPAASDEAFFLGDLEPHKGFDLVLQGAGELTEAFQRVHVVGRGTLQGDARKLESERFRVHGYVDGNDLPQIIQSCATLLLPSRRDPWPLAAVEGLVAGRSLVLGPGVGSAPELTAAGGDAVAVMREATPRDLVDSALAVREVRPPSRVRELFTHEASADVFAAAALRIATEKRTS